LSYYWQNNEERKYAFKRFILQVIGEILNWKLSNIIHTIISYYIYFITIRLYLIDVFESSLTIHVILKAGQERITEFSFLRKNPIFFLCNNSCVFSTSLQEISINKQKQRLCSTLTIRLAFIQKIMKPNLT
jgi:hypothetical protein